MDSTLTGTVWVIYTSVRVQGGYPIRAVAKITGLSADTLRAWERRYAAVVPSRSERGREYGPEQIERLQLLGRLVQRGHAIGSIAQRSDSDLRELLSEPAQANAAGPPKDLFRAVLEAIGEYDAARASDELSRLAALLSPRDLVFDVAVPLMREAGERWHRGEFTTAQEHLVSQILRSLLGSMIRHFRPLGSSQKILLATLPGELHDLGILAAAMLASLAGLDPVYLGPDVPAVDIAEAAKRTGARIVSIGITVPSVSTAGDLQALAEGLSGEAELWVSGAISELLISERLISELVGRALHLRDLAAFEAECLRWRK